MLNRKQKEKANNFAQNYRYQNSLNQTVYYIPNHKIYKKFKYNAEEVIEYFKQKGYNIIDIQQFEKVETYDHQLILKMSTEADIKIAPERQKEIKTIIEELASDFTTLNEEYEYEVNIPHFKILNLGLMPWELVYIYQYLSDKGYNIRGVDLTIQGEDGFKRVAQNHHINIDRATRPYSEIRRREMVARLSKLYKLKKQTEERINFLNEQILKLENNQQDDLQDELKELLKELKKETIKLKGIENFYYPLRKELISHSLRLAFQYQIDNDVFGRNAEDKMSFIYEGLIKGIDKYIKNYDIKLPNNGRYGKEYALSTFVYWAISWNLNRYRYFEEIPLSAKKQIFFKYLRVKRDLEKEKEKVTIEDIKNRMPEVSTKEIEEAMKIEKLTYGLSSLDEMLEEGELSPEIEGTILLENETVLEETTEEKAIRNYTNEAVKELFTIRVKEKQQGNEEKTYRLITKREEKIMRLRFGFDFDNPKSCEEVGKIIGVTDERVRQIESIALKKLRHPEIVKRIK
ncbi:MAG: hypothetical protein IKG27_01755 [Bacilli bacterium]|nr:hypothetical protein [Bacilli bacterium]